LAGLDSTLDRTARRMQAVEDRLDAEREQSRIARARDHAGQRRQIQAVYSDAYRGFGSEPPMALDDEAPSRYRVRLFNRLVRRLPSGHELSKIRADDLGPSPVVLDHFEAELLKAAMAEGERPSVENLPPNGEIVARHRTDDMGSRVTEFFGRESFIAQMGRPGRRVAKIVNPQKGRGPVRRAVRRAADIPLRSRHMRDVRSPWSRERGQSHPRLAESPGSRSNPSNAARSDGGHIARHVGKGGPHPALSRKDSTPVVGGFRDPGDCRD
jgi:hypothetical protein